MNFYVFTNFLLR